MKRALLITICSLTLWGAEPEKRISREHALELRAIMAEFKLAQAEMQKLSAEIAKHRLEYMRIRAEICKSAGLGTECEIVGDIARPLAAKPQVDEKK